LKQFFYSFTNFIVCIRQNGKEGIAVRVEDENVWLHSEAMGILFNKDRCTMYLDYANRQARKFIPMTMEDWKNKLNIF